ncbi:MAG: hypothetical protein WC586_08860 [Methanoregula sp.]
MKAQNGIPIVKLKKNGRVKNRWSVSSSFTGFPVFVLECSRDMAAFL